MNERKFNQNATIVILTLVGVVNTQENVRHGNTAKTVTEAIISLGIIFAISVGDA